MACNRCTLFPLPFSPTTSLRKVDLSCLTSSMSQATSTVSLRCSVEGVRKRFQFWVVLNALASLSWSSSGPSRASTLPILPLSDMLPVVSLSCLWTSSALVLLSTIRRRSARLWPTGGGFGLTFCFLLMRADRDSRSFGAFAPFVCVVFFLTTLCRATEL